MPKIRIKSRRKAIIQAQFGAEDRQNVQFLCMAWPVAVDPGAFCFLFSFQFLLLKGNDKKRQTK